MAIDLAWQPSLLDVASAGPAFDEGFTTVRRYDLGDGAWIEHAPDWLRGADALFARLLGSTPWQQRDIRMYERLLPEPRLTHRWSLERAGPAQQRPPDELADLFAGIAAALGARYGKEFTQVGANLYRDGTDSVAWHGDRVARELPSAVVALVSLGAVRPFRLRPTGGGPGVTFLPGPGDLLVMGGTCQRTRQHSVPKVRSAGPRISVQFRHAYPR
jgi:alkylated DNA repair dioxygenase AlkB